MRFQRGEDDAFREIVRRYQGRIVSLAFRYLRSAADAEDMAQEVFLRVHRARDSYEPSAKLSTWVYRITVNVSLNYLRGRRARRTVSGELGEREDGGVPDTADASAESPPEALLAEERAAVIARIVEGLPERQRMAILLNKYQDLGYQEVADAMGLSVPAVKSLLTRARVAIREKLEPYLATGADPTRRSEA